jgi:outer membrane immunogenic protein
MLRPNVLALALMTAMGLPQAVHASATETSESGVQGSSALGMYREGLIDPEGNLTDPRGASQSVGPIVLERQPVKDAAARKDRARSIHQAKGEQKGDEPLTVTFKLDHQHYHHAQGSQGQVGSLSGVEFGQGGPSTHDRLSQYGELTETFSADPHAAPAGPSKSYTTELNSTESKTSHDPQSLTLQSNKGGVNDPHYAVQLKAFTHFLAGKPAGAHEMAELVIHFNHPVNNPILHISELGGALPSGGFSIELDHIKTDKGSTEARLNRLSGTGDRFKVSDNGLRNTHPNVDCHQPTDKAGAGCGSLEIQGENISVIRMSLKLRTAHPIPEHEKDNLEGGDRIAISVSVSSPAAAVANESTVEAVTPISSPIPPGVVAWTGAYVGVTAGAIFNQSDVTAQNIGLVSDPCKSSGSNTSFLPGALAGYLHQLENDVVVGAEADFTYPWGNMGSECLCVNGSYDRFKTANKVQGSLRARLGYAAPYNLLPYITAGVSFASQSIGYNNEFGDHYSKNTAQTGWVLGAGLEYGFLNGLSVRGEYLYTNYANSLNMGLPTINGAYDSSGQASANVNSNVVRAALNYRF